MFMKYRIESKVRFTLFLTVVFLILIMGISALLNGSYVESSSVTEVYYAITVEPGDTLWSIALEYGDESTDIRRYIYEISNVNNLESEFLTIGQKLIIPV